MRGIEKGKPAIMAIKRRKEGKEGRKERKERKGGVWRTPATRNSQRRSVYEETIAHSAATRRLSPNSPKKEEELP